MFLKYQRNVVLLGAHWPNEIRAEVMLGKVG